MLNRIHHAKTAICLGVLLYFLTVLLPGLLSAQAGKPHTDVPFTIPLLSPAEMTQADANLAVDRQSGIARSAQLYGYPLDASYRYREIACPVAPRYLMLAFEAVQPGGAVSRFTAIVARGGNSTAQIIPILRLGVVPFVPAFASAHSIELFNRTVTSAPASGKAIAILAAGEQSLLLRGLCYAAMVGDPPAALHAPELEQATLQAPAPRLLFLNKGQMQQGFSIRNSDTTYQVWTLTFSSSARLLVAQRAERSIDTTPVVLNAGTNPPPPAGVVLASEPALAATSSRTQPVVAAPSAATASEIVFGSPLSRTPAATAVVSAPPPAPPSMFVAEPRATLPPLPPPPRRLLTNLPMPPGHFILDSTLPSPPQSPAK